MITIKNKEVCQKIWEFFFPEEDASELKEVKFFMLWTSEQIEISGRFGKNRNLDKSWTESRAIKGINYLNILIEHLVDERVLNWEEAYELLDISHIREKFDKFINKELKGEFISNEIDYSIWYNIETDKMFEVVEASSNWSWRDGRHLICLFSLSEGADFTTDAYIRRQIKALGFEEWYEIYKEDLKPVQIIKDEEVCEIADDLIKSLHPETKQETLELMFEQEKEEWIYTQFEDAFYPKIY